MSKQLAIKDVKQGEYIQLKEGSTVWVRGSYIRESKKYEIYKFDDVNHFSQVKGSRLVFVDFEF